MNHKTQLKYDFQLVSKPQSNQINQSTYCDYNVAFNGYDQIRQPQGLTSSLEILRLSEIPIGEQSVLEGGFGTGAYEVMNQATTRAAEIGEAVIVSARKI